MKEEIYYVVDSLGVSHPETVERASEPITHLFVEGGLAGMIAITVLLIALFLAAWKAPKWVKEIGIAAMVVGIFWSICGLTQMLETLQMTGDVSPAVIFGGLKVTLISTLYGLIIYFISLIIRVIQKPRI
jgi:hypothetical protein